VEARRSRARRPRAFFLRTVGTKESTISRCSRQRPAAPAPDQALSPEQLARRRVERPRGAPSKQNRRATR
jgi:hypothetical protein